MRIINNNLFLFKKMYSACPKRAHYLFILSLITAIKSVISVIFIKIVLDCISRYHSIGILIMVVIIERLISFLLSYFECLLQWDKCPVNDITIKEKIFSEVYQKMHRIEMSTLDKPEFYDKYNRAINEAEYRFTQIFSKIESFLSSLLTFFSVFTMIAMMEWELLGIAIISSGVSVLLSTKISKYNYAKHNALTRVERKINYIRRLFYLPQYKEEVKTSKYDDMLIQRLDKSTNEYAEKLAEYQTPIAIFTIVRNWQTFVINFGFASMWIGKKIVQGAVAISSFTSLIYACTTISEALSNIFAIIPQFTEHSLFIENLRVIMDYEPSIEKETNTKQVQQANNHAITVEKVSFRYHSDSEYVLKDISLSIGRGEKIALVGENGAGKSTLVKLLLRLYDPEKGILYFDDDKYQELGVTSLRDAISVVYQKIQPLALTIGENVLEREVENSIDEERVRTALQRSGLYEKVSTLSEKIYTPLTREFEENGIELSGGESQKLVIAKAICKDAGVIIMDEPTSSLDPLSEQEMYQRMIEMCEGKTLVLISHRLYSTKMVDRIYYMEKGMIVERGSHEELMQYNGKYAHMYRVQVSQYE